MSPAPDAFSSIQRQLSAAIDTMVADGILEGYDNASQQLFAVIVAAVDQYVKLVRVDEMTGDDQSLATMFTDQAMLEQPASFEDLDTFRYRHHLAFTLSAIQENLV